MEDTRAPRSTVPEPVEHALDEATRVAVATDESDAALARVRSIAVDLAERHHFDVVLYDRSEERWTDHPHPKGPVTADELEGGDRDHLVSQLRMFEDAGVGATAWLATVPALTAMLDVLQELDVDAVLLPQQLDEPKLMDRIQIGSSPPEMVRRVAELNLRRPPTILAVDEAGDVSVVGAEAVSS